jgi:hypothetical protein
MRFSTLLFAVALLAFSGSASLRTVAQTTGVQEMPMAQTPSEEGTYTTGVGPQYIVVRNFRITEVEATGKPDEYALTLLALTTAGEPDQRVVGGILFDIDGKSTLVPFEQGGVGDVVVKAQPDADEIVMRAVDSNVTQRAKLPSQRRWIWWAGPATLLIIILAVRRQRRLQKK